MRYRTDIEKDIQDTRSLEGQMQLNNELLLDIRSLLMSLTAVDFNADVPKQAKEPEIRKERDPSDIHIQDLPLSTRTKNALKALQIIYLSDLENSSIERLMQARNFGNTGVTEIKAFLAPLGKTLRDYID
jgi:DNA-directed RNA polymerase alpha subunit